MFDGLNKVQLIGTLGADPESRSFSNGGEVVNFRIAVSESWKAKDGQRQERTEWVNIACFNSGLGGLVKRFLKKGSKVYVEGKLQTRKWQDQSGNDRYSTEVVIQAFGGTVIKLDKKDDGGGGGSRSGGYDDSRQDDFGGGSSSSRPQPAAFDTDLDDDVPF
jgi:single-strand DNA-binding protein